MTWEEYYNKFYDWPESAQVQHLSSLTSLGSADEVGEIIIELQVNVPASNCLLRKAVNAKLAFSSSDLIEFTCINDKDLAVAAVRNSAQRLTAEDMESLYGFIDDEVIIEICRQENIDLPKYLREETEEPEDEEIEGPEAEETEEPEDEEIKEPEAEETEEPKDEEIKEPEAEETEEPEDEEIKEPEAEETEEPENEEIKEPEAEETEEPMWRSDNYDGDVVEYQRPSRPGFWGTLLGAQGASSNYDGRQKPHNGRCNGDCANCPPHYGYRYGRWYYGHGHIYGCEFGGNKGDGGM